MAGAIHYFSKDATFDPGVNLDSSGEESDTDIQNNGRENGSTARGHNLLSADCVHNNLTCKCSGTKCICDEPSNESLTWGGPNSGRPGCQGGKDVPNCLKAKATVLYPRDGATMEDVWQCGINHQRICKNCYTSLTCPVCGDTVEVNEGMECELSDDED